MRLITLFSISVYIVSMSACRGQGGKKQHRDKDRIELEQTVTSNTKPQDVLFVNFEKNWRQFISTSPELALPVVSTAVAKRENRVPPPEPLVYAECVFSADAGGFVPQVTLTWNEPAAQILEIKSSVASQQSSRVRFDLSLHHNGFERNYYSAVLSTEKLKRFSLPPNSGLVKDTEAVMLTGPGLFPKLMDFRTEMLQDRDSNRRFGRNTLVLRDLSQGLTYTLRMSRPAGQQWNEDRQFSFLTPVCPHSF